MTYLGSFSAPCLSGPFLIANITLPRRYRQELQSEKRKNQDMTVALRSVQRSHARPGSAINRALSGGALTHPPTWGLGHTQSSVHMSSSPAASLAASSQNQRPATASATMRSAAGSGFFDAAGTSSMASRSGAWGMTPRSGSGRPASGAIRAAGGSGYLRE